jgi:hemerythrin-like domain-containing protein
MDARVRSPRITLVPIAAFRKDDDDTRHKGIRPSASGHKEAVMDPVEQLVEEHKVILQVLDALEVFAGKNDTVPGELSLFMSFIREFVIGIHLAKEEDILFEEVAVHGVASGKDALPGIMMEHAEARRLIRILEKASRRMDEWFHADRVLVRYGAHSLAHHTRLHMKMEDEVFFPFVKDRMSERDWKIIEERFKEFDQDFPFASTQIRLRELAASLSMRYGGREAVGAESPAS